MTKKQIEQIKNEAEKIFPKYPTGAPTVVDEFAEPCQEAYTAAATKYLMQSIDDKELFLQTKLKCNDKIMELTFRIKELEDGLRALFDAPHQEHFATRLNDEEFTALEKLKQLLNKQKQIWEYGLSKLTLKNEGICECKSL